MFMLCSAMLDHDREAFAEAGWVAEVKLMAYVDYGHRTLRQRGWLVALHLTRSGMEVNSARALLCEVMDFLDKLKIPMVDASRCLLKADDPYVQKQLLLQQKKQEAPETKEDE